MRSYIFLENSHKVGGFFFSQVLDTKVVHVQCEHDGLPIVFPETHNESNLPLPLFD